MLTAGLSLNVGHPILSPQQLCPDHKHLTERFIRTGSGGALLPHALTCQGSDLGPATFWFQIECEHHTELYVSEITSQAYQVLGSAVGCLLNESS